MKTKIHKIQPQNWEDVPELSFQTSQTIGDRGYLFGGCVDAPGQRLTFSNELWSYDFGTSHVSLAGCLSVCLPPTHPDMSVELWLLCCVLYFYGIVAPGAAAFPVAG